MSFFEVLGYFEGFIPLDAASKKQLMGFIETHMLVEVHSKEVKKIILVSKLGNLPFYDYFFMVSTITYLLFPHI